MTLTISLRGFYWIKEMKKNSYYFSVDFEDFAFNFLRKYAGNAVYRKEGLMLAMRECIEISEDIGNVFTIFLSGNVLAEYPEIAKTFFENGFEIGSHFFYHDDFNKQTVQQAAVEIEKIMDISLSVYGSTPIGFRAPRFSLTPQDNEHLKLIKKYFKYDSSLVFDIENFRPPPEYENFIYFPLFIKKSAIFSVGTGGTYLKVHRHATTLSHFREISSMAHVPQVYFHPYEFFCGPKFKLSLSEIKSCENIDNSLAALYHWSRQLQWITPGKKNLERSFLKFLERNGWETSGTLGNECLNYNNRLG